MIIWKTRFDAAAASGVLHKTNIEIIKTQNLNYNFNPIIQNKSQSNSTHCHQIIILLKWTIGVHCIV